MPGQIATPVRLGRGRHGIFSPGVAELAGLDAERIVQVAAGRFMSAAVTANGHVWTFGGGFSGELGNGASWSSGPRQVEGILAQVLADNGGAVKVVAGGSFCAALTKSGRVVLWGQPRGGEAMAAPPTAALAAAAAAAPAGLPVHGRQRRNWPPPMKGAAAAAARQQQEQQQEQAEQQQQAEQRVDGSSAAAAPAAGAESQEVPNLRIQKQAGTLVAEVVDLPPMIDVAAGFSHISFTDGGSVWNIGRCA